MTKKFKPSRNEFTISSLITRLRSFTIFKIKLTIHHGSKIIKDISIAINNIRSFNNYIVTFIIIINKRKRKSVLFIFCHFTTFQIINVKNVFHPIKNVINFPFFTTTRNSINIRFYTIKSVINVTLLRCILMITCKMKCYTRNFFTCKLFAFSIYRPINRYIIEMTDK